MKFYTLSNSNFLTYKQKFSLFFLPIGKNFRIIIVQEIEVTMLKERYLTKDIMEDLQSKMVFIGGARQVGKTTLARKILPKSVSNSQYYNWDYAPDRKKIKNLELPGDNALVIFDEIHKYKKWKTTIKGIYDVYKNKYKIVVTGSAKMNIFRKGGDSLQGRYHYYNLHPFSLAELTGTINAISPSNELLIDTRNNIDQFETLFKFGGFPEVLLTESTRTLRRWHNEKLERLFREDIRDVENIRDVGNMKLLGDMLPDKVGSPLSINAIREDLEVSHKAVTNWLSILELFYYHFRIYPYHSNKIRSLKKEAKLYLIDWSEIEDEGIRFENMVASHLLKFVEYLQQSQGYKLTLNYLRNVDKKEVDFLVSLNNKPWFAVEAKLNETKVSSSLNYFKDRLNIPIVYQVIRKNNTDIMKDDIRIISADKFLNNLI